MTEEEAQNKALLDDLAAAQPSWIRDGKGLRGDAIPIVQDYPDYSFPPPTLEFSESASEDPMMHEEAPATGESPDGEAIPHPFQIIIRQNPDTEAWEWSCHTGRLYTNPDMGTLDIGGTGIIPGTGAWNDLTGTTVIWIEVSFDTDGTTPLSVELKSGGSPWSGFPKAGAYTGTAPNERQTFAYRQIGSIAAAGDWVIEQLSFTNYILRAGCWENKPLIEAMPY